MKWCIITTFEMVCHQWRIQDFHLGRGGGRKRFCASTHIMSAEPNSLSAGVQGPLKGPGSSMVILMLSRAIWALFLSILIKNWIKKHSWSNFKGRAPVAPPGSATGHIPSWFLICHNYDHWRSEPDYTQWTGGGGSHCSWQWLPCPPPPVHCV